MSTIIDFVLHIDEHLMAMVANYGTLVYAILFLIVFVETGLIVMFTYHLNEAADSRPS